MPRVKSEKHLGWCYQLQRELDKGADGIAWIAKRKETQTDSPNGHRLATSRSYFCIKQFPTQGGRFDAVKERLATEIVVMDILKDSQYFL